MNLRGRCFGDQMNVSLDFLSPYILSFTVFLSLTFSAPPYPAACSCARMLTTLTLGMMEAEANPSMGLICIKTVIGIEQVEAKIVSTLLGYDVVGHLSLDLCRLKVKGCGCRKGGMRASVGDEEIYVGSCLAAFDWRKYWWISL